MTLTGEVGASISESHIAFVVGHGSRMRRTLGDSEGNATRKSFWSTFDQEDVRERSSSENGRWVFEMWPSVVVKREGRRVILSFKETDIKG